MRGSPVTLVCGRVVDSWSRDWLLETRDRALAAADIVRLADPEAGIRSAVLRLGGGAEQERRLRAVLAELLERRLDEDAETILALHWREDRVAAADRYEARWGAAAAALLRERVLAIWEARRAAVA